MVKTMPYSLYKHGFSAFKATNFNAKTKTIDVDLPNHTRPCFPKEWRRDGNHYYAPNGCIITVWCSGLVSENFLVEHGASQFDYSSKTISAGLYAREKVMEYVASFK